MNNTERDTILAGLRALQDRIKGPPYTRLELEQLATNGGEHEAMTSEEIDDLCERLNISYPTGTGGDDNWNNNAIQYPRLLAEISATQDSFDHASLCESMDLTKAEVNELFERAEVDWQYIKETRTAPAPTVVLHIEGGVIHEELSDRPVRLTVLDADTDGVDDMEALCEAPDGSLAIITTYLLSGGDDLSEYTHVNDGPAST